MPSHVHAKLKDVHVRQGCNPVGLHPGVEVVDRVWSSRVAHVVRQTACERDDVIAAEQSTPQPKEKADGSRIEGILVGLLHSRV